MAQQFDLQAVKVLGGEWEREKKKKNADQEIARAVESAAADRSERD